MLNAMQMVYVAARAVFCKNSALTSMNADVANWATMNYSRNISSTGILLCETFCRTFLQNPKSSAEFWGGGGAGPMFRGPASFFPNNIVEAFWGLKNCLLYNHITEAQFPWLRLQEARLTVGLRPARRFISSSAQTLRTLNLSWTWYSSPPFQQMLVHSHSCI